MNKYTIAIFSTLLVSGCANDLGYKTARMNLEKDTTKYVLETQPFRFKSWATQQNLDYKEFFGNYRVVNSWDNSVYHFDRVSVFEKNGYIYADLYSKGWTKPAHSIQFQGCAFYDEYKEREFGISFSSISLYCSHDGNAPLSARRNYRFSIHKTTKETYAKTSTLGGFVLAPKQKVSITTPYVADMTIFGGDTRPTLALEKVENF